MRDILLFDSATSTNTLLKEMAEKGAKEGLAIVAGEQTGGRGSMGRSFFSPSRSGIYMSILLRPQFPFDEAKFLTPMAAVSVCESIEKISGNTAQIKWVNDIYINNRKVCGILTETSFKNDKIDYAIVGIGVNLEPPKNGFPKEIENIAGSIFKKAPEDAFDRLYREIYDNTLRIYNEFSKKNFVDKYIEKCTYLSGREITVTDGGKSFCAVAGLPDRECRLKVTDSSGKDLFLYSGQAALKI